MIRNRRLAGDRLSSKSLSGAATRKRSTASFPASWESGCSSPRETQVALRTWRALQREGARASDLWCHWATCILAYTKAMTPFAAIDLALLVCGSRPSCRCRCRLQALHWEKISTRVSIIQTHVRKERKRERENEREREREKERERERKREKERERERKREKERERERKREKERERERKREKEREYERKREKERETERKREKERERERKRKIEKEQKKRKRGR